MNPEIVGRSVKTIANLAGLEKVPATARVLVAKETGVGRGHPYSNEKLGPILAFYTAENYEKVCEKVCELLTTKALATPSLCTPTTIRWWTTSPAGCPPPA